MVCTCLELPRGREVSYGNCDAHVIVYVLQHCRGCDLHGAEQGNLRGTVSAEPQELNWSGVTSVQELGKSCILGFQMLLLH